MRESILRIILDRCLKGFERLRKRLRRKLVPEKSAAQVRLISLRIVGTAFRKFLPVFARKLRDQRGSDFFRNCVLELEHIGHVLIELPSPDRRAFADLEQLQRNPKPIAKTPNAPV